MYGFKDGLTKDFPSQIIVDLTEVCNLACIHCPHPVFKKTPLYGKRFLEPHLNTRLVQEVSGEGCQYIRYTSNGEPLIHPKGYEMIKEAVDHSGAFVCLTTNGTIMDEKRTRKLLDSGIHMIDISIDAINPSTYAKIRVGGKLFETEGNVLNLLKWAKGTETAVVVSFIEQPDNEGEAVIFKDLWERVGATVVIRKLHSAAGAVEGIADALHDKDEARYPCLYPWERLTLDPKGHLSFCPTDWKYKSNFTDFRDTTIKEAWQGKFMRELREAHLSNDFSCHEFCGQCPDWQQTNWPNTGRRYADLVNDIKES